ncbi:PREDICTED: uncharacterized protein LOC107102534 isoform X2 [Cyprinodon variegatus]|uniref:uncharacterized protein LOC107102534 isoform X2 n=1 Tax=Cyprinodon variegatus TaxID=28743 RepID=UPI000742C53C|nr:PREDICTED: uncharacterized protein LOC107102534 isoform X2 [Cyprinodon variegatus]
MEHLYLRVFLFVFFLKHESKCSVTKDVSGFKDEEVALMCPDFQIKDPPDCHRARLVNSENTTIFEHPKEIHKSNRVTLKENREGKTCIFLENLQKSDEGVYDFEVWKGWDMINATKISLKVKDCKSLKPEFATPGATVSLNCSMNGETAPSNITWGKLKGKTSVPVDLERVTINGVHLIIKSVTEKDKGWYKCDYMLSQSPRCLSINLLFKDVSVTTMFPSSAFSETQEAFSQVLETATKGEDETSSWVITLVIILILTLAVLTGLFIYKRRKTPTNSAGCFRESGDVYENVNLPCSPGATNRINSLYAFPEESIEFKSKNYPGACGKT